jgi:hypothetical protein
MRRLVADPARARAMGERAYRLFRERYSEDAVLPRYLALVHRFLGRPISPPSLALQDAPQPV